MRLWPIEGKDLKTGLREFLRGRLRLDASFLSDMGNVSLKRVACGPRSKIKNEVIVVFSSTEVRDTVRGSARQLAGHADAGIRLEIPHALQPSLKALEAVSYRLKQNYPDVRRNIKFDDLEKDLVLDFCTDPSTNQPWKKVRPAQAKAMVKKMKKNGSSGQSEEMSENDLERMLGEDPLAAATTTGASGP